MLKAALLTLLPLLPLLPLMALAQGADFRLPSRPQGPAPLMPPEALRAGHQGWVMLRLVVGADGLPQEISVERSSRSPLLDNAARRAVQRLRFQPARNAAGEAVSAPAKLPLEFLEWPEPGQRCDQLGPMVNWTRSTWADDPAEQWRLLGGHLLQLVRSEPQPATTDNEALLQRAERVAAACAATPARPAAEVWREVP